MAENPLSPETLVHGCQAGVGVAESVVEGIVVTIICFYHAFKEIACSASMCLCLQRGCLQCIHSVIPAEK